MGSPETEKRSTAAGSPLRHAPSLPILLEFFGTMAINALVISGSDPGAVPGGSTKHPSFGDTWGRNRIDERLKVFALSR